MTVPFPPIERILTSAFLMHFQNLARYSDIGSNSYLLQLGNTRIVLDAGSHPKHTGLDTLPHYNDIDVDSLDSILISHPHLDHIGSLPCLVRDQRNAAVTMSAATLQSGSALLHNSVNVMKSQRTELNEINYPLYTHKEIDKMERQWLTREVNQPFLIGEEGRVNCEFFHAGHVLGAVGMKFDFEGHSIFYTGDVHFEDQTMTKAAEFPRGKIDTLIMETTRGNTIRLPEYTREREKRRLGTVISETLDGGGSVLIPVFAFGKTQEVLLMLKELAEAGAIPSVPVHIGGLSTKMTRIADKFCNHDARHHQSYAIMEDFPDLKVLPRGRSEPDFSRGHIYAISSGMMSEHTVSNRFAKHILSDSKNSLLFVGYADPATPAGRIQRTAPGDSILLDENTGYEMRLNCRVEKFDFSGHSTREQLVDYALACQPGRVILVHGDPAAKNWFKRELQKKLPQSQIVIPNPAERIPLD